MNIGPEAEQAELVLYYFYLFLSYLITFLQDPVLKKLFGLNFSGTGEPEEQLQEPQGSYAMKKLMWRRNWRRRKVRLGSTMKKRYHHHIIIIHEPC